MSDENIILTQIDRMILESLKTTMEGLAQYLGPAYELVLHSLDNYEHSVIKIINGHHTGRREGAPITDLALNMLQSLEQNNDQTSITYNTKNRYGRPIKATTILVHGEANRVIALLCINFYLDTPLSELVASLSTETESALSITEHFAEDTGDLIEKFVADAIQQVDRDATITANYRNKKIIALLNEWGVFSIKNSVGKIAELLSISINTVYLHLRNNTKKEK